MVNKINSNAYDKFGEVYFVSSFSNIQYGVECASKLLTIFERKDIISRITKRVYIKTRFSILYLSVYEYEPVTEITKRDKAVIIHTGVTDYNIKIVYNEELIPAYKIDYNEIKESFIYGQPWDSGDLIEKIMFPERQIRIIEAPMDKFSSNKVVFSFSKPLPPFGISTL